MSPDDKAYYQLRAAAEREAAKDTDRADVAEIHGELARLYDALIEHETIRPTLRMKKRMSKDTANKSASSGKPNDMGQGSFEDSQAAGKGPSQSKQGPKKVQVKQLGNEA